MAVMRVEKNCNYTVMANYHLRDKRLSLKAKGLLSVMISLPAEWDYRKAQAVYTAAEGKLPTLKELSAEYDALREHKKKDELALEELKPQLVTLNHIKYNCDILMRDVHPEEKYHARSEREDR